MAALPAEGAERLERLLDRVETGYDIDLTTPICPEEGREKAIADFQEEVGLPEFEDYKEICTHELEKVGPYSIMLPASLRRDSLAKYWKQSWAPEETAISQAVSIVRSILPERSLRPAGLETAFNLMPRDTNLGLPWFSRDRSYVASYLERAQVANSIGDLYPCVWFWRGQPRGLSEAPKQRDVWGFDHMDTILCATILYPVLNALRSRPGFSPWLGDVFVDDEATRILHSTQGRQVLSGDYSGFDQTLPRELLDLVDDVLCYWFVTSCEPRIRLLGEFCATVDIVVPGDVLTGRNGGMPSGHGLTNLKDSIANLIAMHYCALRMGCEVQDFMVLGDDFVVLFNGEWTPQQFSDVAKELGLEANPDKQFVSSDAIHFLQRWHSLKYVVDGKCVGCHPPERSLSGLLGYERFRQNWSKWMDYMRFVMQLEVCANDPRFERVVEYVFRRDKVMQVVDPMTAAKRAGGPDNIRSVLSIASFPFNVKRPEGLNGFRTTSVIRQLQG
jgi:hypothetical protein